ncbi:MAG: oxygen-dependent coproporphyrinogen oxidase [Cyclobacteriaceae bacterium]
MTSRNDIEKRFKALQQKICDALEKIDRKSAFRSDHWTRPEGGGGLTRVLTDGEVIEKGGVNFSAVYGNAPRKITDALGFGPSNFYATGVSIVLHPQNPWMPIIHMNIRYFEMSPQDPEAESTYWFGGGIDLTPHYVDPKDAGFFHQALKTVCDKSDPMYYDRFKKWADDYFYIRHRKETRGIGGIFFDRLNEMNEQHSFEELWDFVVNVGEQFIPMYQYFVEKYAQKPYDEPHKQWQLLRRGRYVEFNLVWDKGTKFGLDTDGRTESILMSLPANASWGYDYHPAAGSDEEKTLSLLKKDIDWISYA